MLESNFHYLHWGPVDEIVGVVLGLLGSSSAASGSSDPGVMVGQSCSRA